MLIANQQQGSWKTYQQNEGETAMFLWCLDRVSTMVRRVDRGEYFPQSVRVVEKKPKDGGILTWMIKQIGTSGRRTTSSDLHKAPIDLLKTSCAYVTKDASNIPSNQWHICLETRLINGIFAWKSAWAIVD